MPWFADAGFASYAVSLSGHGRSRRRDLLDSYSISDYVNDLAEVVAELPVAPVLIGHSMGGMVVQKYLDTRAAIADVTDRDALKPNWGCPNTTWFWSPSARTCRPVWSAPCT